MGDGVSWPAAIMLLACVKNIFFSSKLPFCNFSSKSMMACAACGKFFNVKCPPNPGGAILGGNLRDSLK